MFLVILSCIQLTDAYSQTFNQYSLQQYNPTHEDPYIFLCERGIDVEENITQMEDLRLIKQKPKGGCSGGIYRDINGAINYLKHANQFTELMGSKLMNLAVGTKCTPVVKIVRNSPYVVSLEVPGFKTKENFQSKGKIIRGEVYLAIVMAWIGLADGHDRNIGYVMKNAKTALAARVDCDTSFAFDIDPKANKNYNSKSDHLNLHHLFLVIKKYPEKQVIRAIKKIIAFPDEQIISTIFEGWVTLNRAGITIELETCYALAQKLIERKNLFEAVLKNKHISTNPSLKKRQYEALAAALL